MRDLLLMAIVGGGVFWTIAAPIIDTLTTGE